MTAHTKEPWTLDGSFGGPRIIGDNKSIADCWKTNKKGTSGEANAQRIVDCVNACTGIENPAAIGKLIEECRRMRQHRKANQLHPIDFQRVEQAVDALTYTCERCGGTGVDPSEPYDEHECPHTKRIDYHGRLMCRACGAVYNHDTLEWEAPSDA